MTASSFGETATTEEERDQLVPGLVLLTKGELDTAEAANIESAVVAYTAAVADQDLTPVDVLDTLFCRRLHGAMLGQVWTWTGRWRRREANIGIDPRDIPVAMQGLVDDALTWIELDTYPSTELLVRLSYGLGRIHPFVNGNGRFSRLLPELVAVSLGTDSGITWGSRSGAAAGDLRHRYLEALRHVDRTGDVTPLVAFATS